MKPSLHIDTNLLVPKEISIVHLSILGEIPFYVKIFYGSTKSLLFLSQKNCRRSSQIYA